MRSGGGTPVYSISRRSRSVHFRRREAGEDFLDYKATVLHGEKDYYHLSFDIFIGHFSDFISSFSCDFVDRLLAER